MKKIYTYILITIIMICNIDVYAYSNKIILGGDSIGINVKCDGILIVGFYKVDGKINRNGLNTGDYIVKVNNIDVTNTKELLYNMEKYMSNGKVNITIRRDNKLIEKEITLYYENNVFKTGLYIKDSINGVGTLSYIDPSTNIYGALGHEIADSSSPSIIEIKTGTIYESEIINITKSLRGNPGAKNARFKKDFIFGDILKNTNKGIFGKYSGSLDNKEVLEIESLENIKLGDAYLYTELEDNIVKKYKINITNIDTSNDIKNITYEIVDKELLDKTGGVVQGMSGSPIIQDNHIIGAVTHVIISNPKVGYGIGIINMLKEGEKNL